MKKTVIIVGVSLIGFVMGMGCGVQIKATPEQATDGMTPPAPIVGTVDGKQIYKRTIDGHVCYLIGSATYGGYLSWSISCLP